MRLCSCDRIRLRKIAGSEKRQEARTATANVENLERDEHLHPQADWGQAELRADPYFKIAIRSFASSMPPACAC